MQKPYRLHPDMFIPRAIKRCGWPACNAACCIYGAWVDKVHAQDVIRHAGLISPYMEEGREDPIAWFDGQEESDDHALSGIVQHTTVIPNPDHYGGTSCIFLRRDARCALQASAEANQMHPWRFKPFYCILHPMDIDEEGRVSLDETELLAKEPASCIRRGIKKIAPAEMFRQEIEYLIGYVDQSSDDQP